MLVAEKAYLDLVHTLGLPRPTCKEACLVVGSVRAAGMYSADDPEVDYQQYFPSARLLWQRRQRVSSIRYCSIDRSRMLTLTDLLLSTLSGDR